MSGEIRNMITSLNLTQFQICILSVGDTCTEFFPGIILPENWISEGCKSFCFVKSCWNEEQNALNKLQ